MKKALKNIITTIEYDHKIIRLWTETVKNEIGIIEYRNRKKTIYKKPGSKTPESKYRNSILN